MAESIEKIRNYPGCDGHSVQTFLNDDGTYSGFCFPLGKFIDDPYGDKPEGFKPKKVGKTFEQVQEELNEILECPHMKLPDRKLAEGTMRYFGVRVGFSQVDGETPNTIHFPYEDRGVIVGYKNKLIDPKKFWSVGEIKKAEPFGWRQAMESGSPKLFITEGEFDAMALFQMLVRRNKGTKWEKNIPAVISIKSGAGSTQKMLSKWQGKINSNFKEVVIVFDNDNAGDIAKQAAQMVFPHALVAELPCKDANDCLINGKVKGATNAVLFKANKPKNTRLVKGSQLRERARQKPEWGLSLPWEKFTKAIRGKRRGEVIYYGAGVKMGKSELVNALAVHDIVVHDNPVLLCKPEEDMDLTYKFLVSKASGKIFHDPEIEFDDEAYDKYEPMIGDKAIIVDSYQFVDWDTLAGDIKYAVMNEGVHDVIIDPITSLTNHLGTSEANEFLVEMTAEFAAMAKDLKFSGAIFCHLKAPTNGPPHERGGKVLSTQFAGSRAMMRAAHYMIGMEGNKDPELPIGQRNMRELIILEARLFGASEIIPLYWDQSTALFEEIEYGQ